MSFRGDRRHISTQSGWLFIAVSSFNAKVAKNVLLGKQEIPLTLTSQLNKCICQNSFFKVWLTCGKRVGVLSLTHTYTVLIPTKA